MNKFSMEYKFGLCKGRHDLPVEEFLFPEFVDPTDTGRLFHTAWDNIPDDAESITLYITGLTPAVLAVVKVCEQRKISLTAMHYDRETGEYYPQKVLWFTKCYFCGKQYSPYDNYCPHCGSN